MNTSDYWWQSDDPGPEAWNAAQALKSYQSKRVERSDEFIQIYEGRESGTDDDELKYNLSRAACDTVHAEISGRQKPVPKFQTSGADWKTKRKAKRLEKFMSGFLAQAQGDYLNSHELMEDAFLDCSIGGVGAVKVFADFEAKKVVLERHFADELFCDEVEARYGQPKSLFHIFLMDKAQAWMEFGADSDEAVRLAIESSKSHVNSPSSSNIERRKIEHVAHQIEVVEAWHLPCGSKNGIHVFAINGTTVFKEEWKRDCFPFVFTRWERERRGYWGIGLVEQGMPIQRELNDNAAKLQERFRLCGGKRTFFVAGSVDDSFLQENEHEVLIPVKPGFDLPKESTPSPIADAEAMWLDAQFQKFFEITGVSQMRASARKEPGVTAGVAIRTLNDMQTARFSLKARAYENSFVKLTYQVIACMKELADAGVEVVVGKGSDKIKWSEVDMDKDAYDISIAPTSSLPNEPAGRMQMIQELYDLQLIGQETFKQLLGWPDLEKEMNYQTSQSRFIERQLDNILDGKDEHFDGAIVDKNRALIMATQAYFEARYDDAPEPVLASMRMYIQEISAKIQQMQFEIAKQAMQMQNSLMATEQAGMVPAQPPQAA